MTGPVKIYFKHDRNTPGNIREVWHEASYLPPLGARIELEHMGGGGTRGTFTVRDVLCVSQNTVEITVSDPTPVLTRRPARSNP